LPADCLGLPDEETMTCEDGLVENHHYRDLRGIPLVEYEEIAKGEAELLAYEGDLDSDEASEHFADNWAFTLGLDPGTASTVAAISVIGACPVTSCCGGPGHYEKHPLVYFWCEPEHAGLVLEAAAGAGVEVDAAGSPGVLVYTHGSVGLMRDFAERLIVGWKKRTGVEVAPPTEASALLPAVQGSTT
jgi:hypothetical protein